MNGEREQGDAICEVCGEWYWFSPGVCGGVHCWPDEPRKTKKTKETRVDADSYRVGMVEVLRVTDRAILVAIRNHDDEWIARSQIHEDSHVQGHDGPGETGVLIITKWLAKKKAWA